MRKLSILLILLLLFVPAHAEEEEELSLTDALAGAAPGVVVDTLIVPPQQSDTAEEAVSAQEASIYEPDGSVLITITGTGDFTVGGDSRKSGSLWQKELDRNGGDFNFALKNVRDILLADDLTIVNFEGTLTNSSYVPANKRENQFLFSASPDHVRMLTENGVEAVAFDNNHVMDHGEEVYEETMGYFDQAGVVYSTPEHLGVIEVKGVEIAMLSYLCIDRYDELWERVPAAIQAAKAQYPIVIVNFHWGNEKRYDPTKNQIKMGRLAVDAGADLVLGHHSHRIQPIEQYKGVYICYSLGNFCFAGHNKPDDMSSILFQTRFRVKDGDVSSEGFRIIPIRISSRTDRNDFTPTVHTRESSIDAILNTLRDNGRSLTYAVENYPTEWSNNAD